MLWYTKIHFRFGWIIGVRTTSKMLAADIGIPTKWMSISTRAKAVNTKFIFNSLVKILFLIKLELD